MFYVPRAQLVLKGHLCHCQVRVRNHFNILGRIGLVSTRSMRAGSRVHARRAKSIID